MTHLVRLIAGFLLLAVLAAACSPLEGDGRALVPLSNQAKLRLADISATPGSGMLVRIFKEESELEIWKETDTGAYRLFKTYDICAWSGDLGPKISEGDRQSPEGFSTITPGLMNPNSNYYLAFNTGFPNKYDRSYGRTGSALMVHGDCSSRGCYAMTDEQIGEIYALARESFSGGNRSFQLQIFPFRMTPENMVAHRDNENMPFWRNLKEGYDHFEVTHVPVQWDVCGRRYVFNTVNPSGRALDARQACPADLTVEPTVMALVAEKQANDDAEINEAIEQIEVAEARAAERAEEREQQAALAAQREAEFNESVDELFGGIFGEDQAAAAAVVVDTEAPTIDDTQVVAGTIDPTLVPPQPMMRPGTLVQAAPETASDPIAAFFGNLFGGNNG